MANLRERIEQLVIKEKYIEGEAHRLGPEAVPILIEIFETASGELLDRIRRNVLLILGVIGTEEAIDFLIATADHPQVEGWLRRAAVRSLGAADHPKAIEYLKLTLEHPEKSFRTSAVLALGRSPAPEATEVLRSAQETDPDERVRARAAKLTGEMQEESEEVQNPDKLTDDQPG